MFSVNLKLTNKRIVTLLAVFALVVTLLVAVRLQSFCAKEETAVQCNSEADVKAYLESFGLRLGECTVDQITVPFEFGEVYENYNSVQLSQGFDLSEHKGKTLQRYTFAVTEHPDGDDLFAEVLLLDKKIVGADIYSTALDGFIAPLK